MDQNSSKAISKRERESWGSHDDLYLWEDRETRTRWIAIFRSVRPSFLLRSLSTSISSWHVYADRERGRSKRLFYIFLDRPRISCSANRCYGIVVWNKKFSMLCLQVVLVGLWPKMVYIVHLSFRFSFRFPFGLCLSLRCPVWQKKLSDTNGWKQERRKNRDNLNWKEDTRSRVKMEKR